MADMNVDRDRYDRHRSSRHDDRDRHGGGDRGYGDRDRDRYASSGRRDDRYSGGGHGDRGDRDRHRDSRGGGGGDSRGGGYGGGGDRGGYDRGPPRRDHGDGGRGGGGGGRDRDGGRGGGGGGRKGRGESLERRSATPENCLPLSQRKRKASGWDIHAPGYEQYTALQAKQTGLFPLPGANRQQVPPILSMPGLPMPMPVQTFGMGIGGNPNLSRQSRRLYIGSITPEITETNLQDFFNAKMKEMNLGTDGPGDPVLAVQCNYEKNYAFVEFRSADDATAAMAFDGIIFINGPLKIRRPKDYGGELGMPGIHVPGVVSTNVPDSINKIFVGGLPMYLDEAQVQELLTSFGELKAFNLVRENNSGPSKGFAFFEYVDPGITEVAIQSLNGMELGDKFLVVQRASVGAAKGLAGVPAEMFSAPELPRPIMPAGDPNAIGDAGARILMMLNMINPDELGDDAEYGDIVEDVRDECSKFGTVLDLRIPRPQRRDRAKWGVGQDQTQTLSAADAQRMDEASGVGRVYVKFEEPHGAQAALQALAGRSFGGRSIIATLLADDSNTTPPLALVFAPQPDAPPPLPIEN